MFRPNNRKSLRRDAIDGFDERSYKIPIIIFFQLFGNYYFVFVEEGKNFSSVHFIFEMIHIIVNDKPSRFFAYHIGARVGQRKFFPFKSHGWVIGRVFARAFEMKLNGGGFRQHAKLTPGGVSVVAHFKHKFSFQQSSVYFLMNVRKGLSPFSGSKTLLKNSLGLADFLPHLRTMESWFILSIHSMSSKSVLSKPLAKSLAFLPAIF